MEPVTLVVLGGLAAVALFGGAKVAANAAPVLPPLDPCAGYNFEAAVLDATAAGAITTGATTASPYGAGAGAALGAAQVVLSGCGKEKFAKELKKASAAVCAKANRILGTLNAKPKDWDKWSCDQRLAYVVAAGPLLGQAVLAGNVAASAFKATQNEVKRLDKNASKAAEKVGDAAKDLADSVGDGVKKGLGSVGIKI